MTTTQPWTEADEERLVGLEVRCDKLEAAFADLRVAVLEMLEEVQTNGDD